MKKKFITNGLVSAEFQKILNLFLLKILVLMVLILTTGLNFELKAQKQWIINPGENYRDILTQLQPGDELILHEGIYEGSAAINISGLPGKPIIIRGYGKGEERPVLLWEGKGANLLQIGASNIVIDFLEFRAKYVYAIRLRGSESNSNNNVTIKNCVFYMSGGGDISANSSLAYDNIQILDNYFIGSQKTAVYIGIHDGKSNVTNFVFKGNVIDGSQIYGDDIVGYGIELKLNVTKSLIENNYITGTKGPCIMVYGAENLDADNANIVRNNIVVGSRQEAGIVVGGGPSTIEGNLSLGCKGGISVQNYGNRNLLHNVVLLGNTAVCDRTYGMTFGNVQNITARNNVVITKDDLKGFTDNPNSGTNNIIINATNELEKKVLEEIITTIPARNNLEKIWQRVSSGPLNQADVLKIIDLIQEYKIPGVNSK
jgi:hypothetical protein